MIQRRIPRRRSVRSLDNRGRASCSVNVALVSGGHGIGRWRREGFGRPTPQEGVVSTRLHSSAEPAVSSSATSRRTNGGHERPAPAFELLASKLLPPQGPGGAVSRQALIEVIERATAVPVVFLSAGPGWGKTTLLAEWAARSSAAVCVGERRRQGQRPDRPADVCRDRARPRLAARRERVRGPVVAGRVGRGNDRAAAGRSVGRRRRAARAGAR